MKTLTNIGITFLTIICFQISLLGQQGSWKLTPSYSVAVPVGNFKNLVEETSVRGWNAEIMYGINEQTSVGLSGGFQDFYQRYPRTVMHSEGSALSAVVTNSLQVIPIMLKAKHFLSAGNIQPFASLAAGGNIIQYQKYYGQFVEGTTKFGFVAQPEIGVYMPFGKMKRIGLNIAGAYNFMPFEFNDADGLSNIALKAGLTFPLQR